MDVWKQEARFGEVRAEGSWELLAYRGLFKAVVLDEVRDSVGGN